MKIRNLLIGSDPEFFLLNGGNPQSAVGLIGGTKASPKEIADGIAVLEDNVMVEFNTPPTTNHRVLYDAIQTVKGHVLDLTKPLFGVGISTKSSHVFKREDLNNIQARQFGCDPDYNVWTEKRNRTPSANENVRYAGGHIHLGFERDDNFIKNALTLVKLLDFTVGVPSVVLDTGVERRSVYGKAGTFRVKSYGVEYRSPSNYWIFSENEVKDLFDRIEHAVDLYESDFNVDDYREDIISIINNSDVDAAKKLSEEHGLL